MLKKADLFPANPRWSIEGKQFGSTWKTFILTLLVLAASCFLSYNDFTHFWRDKSNLQLVESSLSGSGQTVNSVVFGVRFVNNAAYSQLNLEYSNGQKAPRMDSCPSSLTSIDANMVCFRTRDATLNPNDTMFFYRNSTTPLLVQMTIYCEVFQASQKLRGTDFSFQPLRIFNEGGWTNLTVIKQKLVLFNSIVPGRDPETAVGLSYKIPIATATSSGNRSNCVILTFQDTSIMPVFTATRLTFPIILAGFISNIQLLTGIVGVLMILINSLYLKVELAKRIYDNSEVQKVLVSYLFTIRYAFLSGLCLVGLHRCILKKGWLRSQYICKKAFEDMDEKLSVENILKVIQTIKQNKMTEQPTSETKQGYVPFEYGLVQSTPDEPQLPIKPSNKLAPSRSAPKKSWLGNLIRAMQASPITAEFNVDKQYKSSLLSIIFTYLGIGALVFILIYLNSFSMETNINNFSSSQQGVINYNSTFQPVVLTVRRTTTQAAYPMLAAINMSASLSDTLGNSYAFDSNCSRPGTLVPTRQFSVCFNDNLALSPTNDVTLLIKRQFPRNSWTFQFELGLVEYYMRQDSLASRYALTTLTISPGDPMRQYLFNLERQVVVDNGVRSESFRLASVQTVSLPVYGPTDFGVMVFRVNDKVRYRYITNVSLSQLFIRIWGLNLVFFVVMALYISKPYNRKVAKKVFGRRFTEDASKEIQKGDEILRINNLLLFLRSKMDSIDENSFFKENITPLLKEPSDAEQDATAKLLEQSKAQAQAS